MEKLDMKELLEDEFIKDPLRKEIELAELESELYTENILKMHPDTTYSTTEAAEFIGRNDGTLRNYFRNELFHYIGPARSGKYYRLDYKSIFKLHMILLLVEKANKKTADLAHFVGVKNLTSTTNFNPVNVDNHLAKNDGQNQATLIKEIEELRKHLIIQKLTGKVQDANNSLTSTRLDYSDNEREISNLENKIENLQSKYQREAMERRYYRVLDQTMKATQQKVKKRSWLSLFTGGSNEEEMDVESVLNDAISTAEEERNEQNFEEVDQLKSELNKKIEKRERLKEEIEKKQTKVEENKSYLNHLIEHKEDIKRNDVLKLLNTHTD
ncbi:coiled-coil domain-containing protein [Halobacillus litoralis]|uniref:Uncharacterized protein n=1 Tax=Halobacillus litoralis TaxID=45668 RepID=A0A410MJC8_9BACI|nr:hypothetical protein [Halobacillus litoralis]QAS54800.1 hypothetical protein HLI_21330 [Halobacillus litoralis]